MTATSNTTARSNLTNAQAVSISIISLFLGIGGGYLFRRSRIPSVPAMTATETTASSAAPQAVAPPPELSRTMVDAQAAAKLEQLKADPSNPGLLTDIGNIYYDGKQYPAAIDYYNRALKGQPADTAVRTDLATAYWYTGDADTAIAEFSKSLTYEPTKANTLFNLGIVKWQGKHDGPGAIAAWQKLLETNPNYENKPKVQELIAQARQ